MTYEEQFAEFIGRLRKAHPDCDTSEAKGASNAPWPLEGGFRFGLYNVDNKNYQGLANAGRALALVTRLVLPPGNVLHLAMVFSGDGLRAAGERRGEIAAGEKEGKANKVRFYVSGSESFGPSRGVYMAQEDFSSVDPVPEEAGAAVTPEVVYFADIEHDADLNPVEIEYVRFLGGLLGSVPLKRLGSSGTTLGGQALDPKSADVSALTSRIRGLGGYFDKSLVERYHVALNHLRRKHFVLLTGISGTGKTLLAKAYAYAVLGLTDLSLSSDDFELIAVRPDWSEPVHLLGFMDAVSGTYSRTRFVDAAMRARLHPERPVFVCLDEMNLAQPEHYFADALSSMESGEPLRLHSDDKYTDVPASLTWPENLYITGTVNVDETTRTFSPKVLDRANVIDMSDVDIAGFCGDLTTREPQLAEALGTATVGMLASISTILRPHHLHFGNRVAEELGRYLRFAKDKALLPAALDVQIEQKILTKLRGGPEQREMLDQLASTLSAYPASLATVLRMRKQLDRYESFQYWA